MDKASTLWSAVKIPVLSKLSLLGSGAPVVFGPVMALTSLPRIALSLNGDSNARGSSQLSKIVGDVSSRLRRSLRTFEDLLTDEPVPPSTQTLMQEPLEEFLNLKFLNLALPVVGQQTHLSFSFFSVCPLSLSCCLPKEAGRRKRGHSKQMQKAVAFFVISDSVSFLLRCLPLCLHAATCLFLSPSLVPSSFC